MKNIIYLVLVFISVRALVSCEKNLEKTPKSALTPENFYNDDLEANAGLAGVYYRLQNYTGTYAFRLALLTELTTDDQVWARAAGTLVQLNTYTFDATNREVESVWQEHYQLIAYANTLIKYVSTSPGVTQKTKERIEAESRFLRAIAYFNLTNLYGKVPLVLQPVETISGLEVPRDEVQLVYDQIIKDLQFAEGILPVKLALPASERGRATKAAATAMLARVYLTMASPGTQGVTASKPELYQKAADQCKKILDGTTGIYSLLKEYGRIFALNNEYNDEVIFDVQYKSGNGAAGNGTGAIFGSLYVPLSINGSANMFPRPQLYNSFPAGDERRAWGFWTQYTSPAGATTVFPQPYMYKYVDIDMVNVNNSGDGGINYILLRMADIYLMYAEALNELNRTGEAYQYINAVRARAKISDLPSGLDKTAFRNAVWQERRWEFFGEQLRRFDLVRQGRLVSAVKAIGDVNNKIADHNVLLPIPQRELNTNKHPGFTQNTGY